MPVVGYDANLPNDVVLDHGIVRIGSTNIGVTKGPPKWEPGWMIDNVGFDGKDAPIKGLDRKFYGEPVLSFAMIQFGPAATGNQIAKLEAGASEATSGSTPNTKTTATPKAGRSLYASGDYLADVRVIYQRGIAAGTGVKQYAAIYMACALVRKWDIQGADKAEVTINIEIAGRKDMAAGNTYDAPYLIEYLESLP